MPTPRDITGVARAEDVAPIKHVDAAARHCTASSLHGHNLPLQRHPISQDTNGEPGPSLLAARPCCFGHGTLHQERVGQGRLRPLGTHALTRTSVPTPRPPHRRPVVLLRASPSPPCRRGRRGAPTGHMGDPKPRLEPWIPSPCSHGPTEALIRPAKPPGSLHARPHHRRAPSSHRPPWPEP